jgi:hypothetical protein
MNSPRKPSVLFVFYTHTAQSRRVADAMAGVLRERGCDVSLAGIEFTDPRYAGKFGRFPFRHAVLDLLAVLPAQVRRSTGQIRIPDAAREGDYDLVCLGSGRDVRALPRGEDSADQSQAGFPRAGPGLREQAGGRLGTARPGRTTPEG